MKRRTAFGIFDRDVDRIEKGVEIFNAGYVKVVSEGVFAVFSPSAGKFYQTTLVSCQCEDFHFRVELCKHQWASWGAKAAEFILKIRSSHSFVQLDSWSVKYANFLCDVPENFLQVVREEYRKRLTFIYESQTTKRVS